MELVKVEVNGAQAKVVSGDPIPANAVGGKILFTFGPEWDGLIKTVVLKGCTNAYITDAGDLISIPQEVVAQPGERLLVGVCGIDKEETVVIPTLWADLGWIRSSAWPEGEEALAPALPIWIQLERRMRALERGSGSGLEPEDGDIPKVFIDGVIPTTKEDVLAELTYVSRTESFHAYIKIKCQGTSSMSYPKKNFTVTLYCDEAREERLPKLFRDWKIAADKFCLKANYIDHSHARNIVCAKLWNQAVACRDNYDALPEMLRESPCNGAVDGFPIKVYTNGSYQGIYTWNIPKEAWMWNMDGKNISHILMCAETNTDGVYAENASNFRKKWSGKDGEDWSIEVGPHYNSVKTSLNALISFVMNSSDASFKAALSRYLDVQSAIDYYLHQYVICGVDGLAKNMLLATYDGIKWYCGAYDMDATFGLTPQGAATVLATTACPEGYQERYSLLWERLVANFSEEIKARYAILRRGVYSLSNIVTQFERFMDGIGMELYAEDETLYDIPSAGENNIKNLRNFIRNRLNYVDARILTLGENIQLSIDEQLVWYNGFYLNGSNGEAAEGKETDSCTDFVKLNGAEKILANGRYLDNSGAEVIPNGRIHFYDAGKNQLSYVTNYDNAWEHAVAVPENAAYVRFYTPITTAAFNAITDADRNGFVQLDADSFVANQMPSASGLISAENKGYYDLVIPVSQGQNLWLCNGADLFKSAEETVYGDKHVIWLDADGGFISRTDGLNDSAMVHLVVPAGAAGMQIAVHSTIRNYVFYKLG